MSNFRCSIQNIKRHQDAVPHTSSHSIVPVILSIFGGLLLCLISGAAFKILETPRYSILHLQSFKSPSYFVEF